MWRGPWIWLLVALLVRGLVAWRTAVPSHDVHYLWMGEQVAVGNWAALFDTAHHPLYGMLVGLLLWSGPEMSGMAAGQLVSCGLGALAVVPLFYLGRRLFDVGSAHVACLLYAVGLWFARHPAACQAEGPFYLFVATTAWWIARGKPFDLVAAGVTAALAYTTKPEGAALLLVGSCWLWIVRRRAAPWFLTGFACVGLLLPLGFWGFGHGFTVSPKLSFILADGVAGADVHPVSHYLEHLLRALGVCFEGIGYLVFPLAVFGVVRSRAYRIQDPRFVLVALFVLQLLVIPLLRSHVRFVSGYGVLLLPFAGAAFLELSLELCRGRGRTMLVAGLLLVTLPDLLRLPKAVNAQRLVVRELGEWLAPKLSHDDMLVTEMARLQYFAGVKPGPPRRLLREEILDGCSKDLARFCVVVPGRTGVGDKELTALGFRPMALPPRIARMAKQRRMLVYERLPR